MADINAAKQPDKTLAREALAYCKKHGDLCPLETFFDSPELTRGAEAVWSDNDFLTWLVEETGPKVRGPGRSWNMKEDGPAVFRDSAVDIVRKHFVYTYHKDSYRLYKITDPELKLVRPVAADRADAETDIYRTLVKPLEEDGVIADKGFTKLVFEYFEGHGKLVDKPAICAQRDDDRWCQHRLMLVPDAACPWPLLRAFLDRMNDGDAFAAWLYGIYSGRYQGRQILYLSGERGQDGKSAFFKAFAGLFGDASTSLDWAQMKNNPSFVGSLLVDKKFGYVPDNKNPKIIMTEIFKSLANPGDDPVIINHKYGKMYSTELECHVAVISNYEPDISGEGHNTTRTFWIKIAPLADEVERDPQWKVDIVGEMAGLLAYGKECYERLCTNDYDIEVNEAVQQAVATQIELFAADNIMILEEHFVVEKDAMGPTPAGMRKLLKEDGLKADEASNFIKWVQQTHGVTVAQGTDGVRRYRGIRTKTGRDHAKPKAALHLVNGGAS
jgi:hypothetical protein